MIERLSRKYATLSGWQKVGLNVVAGVAGVGAGIVAAPAIGAAVSVAGLGVLGGCLSGAAASSAGLAFLGGGAVITGGLGMAGGTAVVAGATGAMVAGAAAVAGRAGEKHGRKINAKVKSAKKRSVNHREASLE